MVHTGLFEEPRHAVPPSVGFLNQGPRHRDLVRRRARRMPISAPAPAGVPL
jgi:hypothetical protein